MPQASQLVFYRRAKPEILPTVPPTHSVCGMEISMIRFHQNLVSVSVRNLVEFVLRSGDIDNRNTGISDKDAMQAGSRLHKKIQRSMGDEYVPEVPLRQIFTYDDYDIIVEGRADGIITSDAGVVIDEIKGTYSNVSAMEEPVMVHKAQAMCYAYIYAEQMGLTHISVQMTYCNLDDDSQIRYFKYNYEFEEIEEWFQDVIQKYRRWVDYTFDNLRLRQESIKNLEFPFEYRKGQRDIVVSAYRTIMQRKNLFIQAPTGVGKTISTIFPAIMAMGQGCGQKIFYVTAKTITRTVAEETFRLLRAHGLCFKSVTITAKDKICILDKPDCNPDVCPRAKGHFDRINDALYDILTNESEINRDKILYYAEKHNVCPFEMNLDCTDFTDGIICDYNYIYDPKVRLKRYFADGVKGEYIVLADEAHNMIDRTREMYSALLKKEHFLEIKKTFKNISEGITKALDRCNREFLELRKMCDGPGSYCVLESIESFITQLMRLQGIMKRYLDKHKKFEGREEILDFYFECLSFLDIYELVDDKYVIYAEYCESKEFIVKLFCVNPSGNVSACMNQCLSTVFFSATLLPVNYYKELISGNIEDYAVYIDSPFEQKNRIVFAAGDVSSIYKRRNITEYQKIAEYIRRITACCKGNYLAFFPSYKMMNDIGSILEDFSAMDNVRYIYQNSGMDEKDRERFLDEFKENNERTLIGMCVQGGVFSEGIDLKHERLIGSIIVGTGLPQICTERIILDKYYKENGKNGFNYAYRYPGMNKVLQAAGRVIRTDEDYGIIALLDERFMQYEYRMLYPREWNDIKCFEISRISDEIKRFWKYV